MMGPGYPIGLLNVSTANRRLYVRIRCPMCKGSRAYSAGGYQNPMEPGKWGACPYCDMEGMTYVEAAVDIIAECAASLPADKQAIILQRLNAEKSDDI